MSQHAMRVEIEQGGVHFRVICPNDPADETRDCWPLEVDGGDRLPAPQECVYLSWCENVMPDEWHVGPAVVLECDAEFDWSALGDQPIVSLSNPRVPEVSP